VPAAHCTQASPSAPEKPGAHLQAVIEVLPAGELALAGQATHAERAFPAPDL